MSQVNIFAIMKDDRIRWTTAEVIPLPWFVWSPHLTTILITSRVVRFPRSSCFILPVQWSVVDPIEFGVIKILLEPKPRTINSGYIMLLYRPLTNWFSLVDLIIARSPFMSRHARLSSVIPSGSSIFVEITRMSMVNPAGWATWTNTTWKNDQEVQSLELKLV